MGMIAGQMTTIRLFIMRHNKASLRKLFAFWQIDGYLNVIDKQRVKEMFLELFILNLSQTQLLLYQMVSFTVKKMKINYG